MAAGGGHQQILIIGLIFLNFAVSSCSESYLHGIYPTDSSSLYKPGSPIQVLGEKDVKIMLVGNISSIDKIFLTPSNSSCSNDIERTETFDVTYKDGIANVIIKLHFIERSEVYYVCLHDKNAQKFEHAGTNPWIAVQTFDVSEDGTLLPLPLQIAIAGVLLILSGLFSGLNLGLMSLDKTELEIIEKVGSENEKKYARRIGPLRSKGNLLLCTLLLGNVMVNSTFTIFFDDMTNGLIAFISSTVGIVVFGEIIPQAICSRHGLAVGANTYWLTKFFMFVTFPASYPVSIILDKILGEEMGQVYSKEKLQELIRMTADRRLLHHNEANIISGALQLTNKSVEDVMTPIDDVYMLQISTVLDFDTLSEILRHGYTRVPVYDGDKTNIVSLLNTKDLALIDPDDNTLLSTVCKYYDHRPLLVDYNNKLDTMLQEFLQGNSHMAIVQKLHNAEDKDPYYETMGVVTLEDVIEEILQSEIIDETDMMSE
ncbi:metal transporter CNNM4-like [Elysia marginata]|uniref:Metal transporter CNNM4-like n=1 Tax=Elysia marginata TaxID=1093978 RepID=A0AAV4HZA0_9GAST|nr:metal transporter CNNM4-like [Elysia marginata]